MSKDTFFTKNFKICSGNLPEFSSPVIMGILNATPDSFFSSSRTMMEKSAIERATEMLDQGAGILDIGGCSTRPGSKDPGEEAERERVIPIIKAVYREFPEAFISVDTYRSSIAEEAIQAGARIINDVSGGEFDPDIYSVAARNSVPYVLMHMKGTPDSMQIAPEYENVVNEVIDYFKKKIEKIRNAGVKDIILDPGFGFGKNLDHNYSLLSNLHSLRLFDMPIMIGVSRKSMVTRLLNLPADQALNGTTVLHTLALLKGAQILRVHDVAEAMQAIRITQEFTKHRNN